MVNYLTPSGLQIPLLQDILGQMQSTMWLTFGNSLNLLPSSVGGQLLGVFSNAYSDQWQNIQEVYQNWNPNGAGGVSLDNVVAVSGIRRLPATYGVGTLTANGTLGTVIDAFALTVSVSGNPDVQFQNTLPGTIAAGTNAIQHIAFSAVPDAGQWTLVYSGNQTTLMNFNAPASGAGSVQAALTALSGLAGVTVAGDYTAGFDVTFAGSSGSQPQPVLAIGSNTLTHTAVVVAVTITQPTPGVFPHVDIPVQCLTTGDLPAYAGTLTVIVTPVSGVDTVSNADDIIPGQNIETDSALRIRRSRSLAFPGSANPDAILAKVLQVTGVVNAIVDNNYTFSTNGNNTPGKSFQVIVLGGDDQALADAIWAVGPAGIEAYGTTTETVTDASGNPQTVGFSRPDEVEIDVHVSLHPLSNYPVGGDTAVKEAIANYGTATFSVGDDVIAWELNIPCATVAGIDNLAITIRRDADPFLYADIAIAATEISSWSTSNISVSHT